MVAYATEDGNESEGSSICHSPTWDDYGKKKKKKDKKEQDTKRKRLTKLTKDPPPVSMENRAALNPRAMTDSVLSVQQLRQRLEGIDSSQQPNGVSTDASLPVPVVETTPRNPAFIGGVRLEREREAVTKQIMHSRGTSVERPTSEMMLRSPDLESRLNTSIEKKRETAPPVSYPPTSSKTPFSRPTPRTRHRSGSFGLGIKGLFSSKDKDSKDRDDSRSSISSLDAQERGRQMSGSSVTHSRNQSIASNDDYAEEEPRRGAISMPPESWKNKYTKPRTASLMGIPPDSAGEGSFSPHQSPRVNEDNFDFLDHPFSPHAIAPLSPPTSLSASVKVKMSPALNPKSAPSPVVPSPVVSSRKTFRETLRAGFRSSSATREPKPAARKRSGSGMLHVLVGAEMEAPSPRRESFPLQSPRMASKHIPAWSAQDTRRSSEPTHGQAGSGNSKDSRTSSASSHPGSGSLPPSPMTTPEGSRPQSKKDNQAFLLEQARRAPPLSYENVIAMRGSPTLPPRSSYLPPKKVESPRMSAEQPSGTPKDVVSRQHGWSGSNFKEDLPPSGGFLTDESWITSKKPVDPDQMSFTSALTSLDVKRSFTDLDSSLKTPNSDVTPLSLEDASKATAKKMGTQASPSYLGFQFDLSNSNSPTNSSPGLTQPAASPRAHGRLPSNETSQRSTPAWTGSPNPQAQTSRKASDYLQEARKAVPSSPRPPHSNASSNTSLPSANSTAGGPRTFALSQPKSQPKESVTATTTSAATTTPPSQVHPMQRPSAAPVESPLGTPISKVLVECCHCKFYHDMPSRVYEAMAQPDDVVKDKVLGVSGTVTMCVKCPWCSHNMSTVCCAGYAAVVYLKEKLHGA